MRFRLLLAITALILGCESRDRQSCEGAYLSQWERLVCDEESRTCELETGEELLCPGSEIVCSQGDARCEPQPWNPCAMAEPLSGVEDWINQIPSEDVHVIDGAFTGDEWTNTTSMEGLFTDVYMDYREGRLYFLNDWRLNDEGIRADCFNFFGIRIADSFLDLKVFGDGHVEIFENNEMVEKPAEGAYGFGPSPRSSIPHTIYEFFLEIEADEIDVCSFDPIQESNCELLAAEPMVVSLRVNENGVQTRRAISDITIPRLGPGAPCDDEQGICATGLRCEGEERERRCSTGSADGGVPDSGPG